MSVAINIQSIMPALVAISEQVLQPQFEQEPATYNMFARDSRARFVNGKGYRIPSHIYPATGVSAIGEGGSFKQPGTELLADMYVSVMNLSMAYEITGSALKNLNADSIIRSFNGLLQMRTAALMKEANYQMYDDGSALRGVYVAAGSTSTTLNLTNATTTAPTSGFGWTKGAVHMRVGEQYDVYSSNYATYRGTVIPTSKTATSITIASNTLNGLADGDKFVLSGSLYKAPRGLPYLINNDSGTFQLLSRATYPELRSPVVDLGGASISVADFVKTKNLLIARAGIGKAKTVVAITSLAQDDALRRLGQNFKRWDGNAREFDGSFDSFRSGDTVTALDPDCDEHLIYMVCKDEINKYEQRPFGMYDLDGLTLRMRAGVSGYGADAYTGAMGAWYNFGTKEPRCHALIKGCNVSGLATQVAANA